MLERLQLSYVHSEGYVNLRCVWTLGCPEEIHPLSEHDSPLPAADGRPSNTRAGNYYKEAFEDLLPGVDVPETVAVPCCAQFAATAKQIKERPKQDYTDYRNWLLATNLEDHLSGRILEYLWHSTYIHKPAMVLVLID